MIAVCRLCDPLVVAIVVTGLVMIAAGVLVVALTYIVGHVLVAAVGIHIAYETFLLAAVWAGEFLLTAPRYVRGL